jgi:hypothetical protein
LLRIDEGVEGRALAIPRRTGVRPRVSASSTMPTRLLKLAIQALKPSRSRRAPGGRSGLIGSEREHRGSRRLSKQMADRPSLSLLSSRSRGMMAVQGQLM